METKKVLVIADFASLSKDNYQLVVGKIRSKYIDHLVLPYLDEKEKEFNQQSEAVNYEYFLCTVERSLFNEVKVKYFITALKTNRTIMTIKLKAVEKPL